MKANNNTVRLTERDVKILELLTVTGFLTTKLALSFGVFTSLRATQRRFKMLVDAGFLGIQPRTLAGYCEYLYYPIYQRLHSIIDKDLLPKLEKVCFFQPWKKSNTTHEDTLRQWAILITRAIPDAELELDFMLYNNRHLGETLPVNMRRQMPDMIVRLNATESVNIEIELTLKADSRYSDRLMKLITEVKYNTIYLTDSPAILKKVQSKQNEMHLLAHSRGTKIRSHVYAYLFSEVNTEDKIRSIFAISSKKDPCTDPCVGRKPPRKEDENLKELAGSL